jgi:hypothetical protein
MRAHLTVDLRDAGGALLAHRSASNSVMRSGAELVAQLFAGRTGGITHMAVGTDDQPETDQFSTVALSAGDLQGGTEAPIAPQAFTFSTDADRRLAVVRVRGTMPQTAAIGKVREAGLVSRVGTADPLLYNRVTFTAIDKGDDHELTLFWEVFFPYGDLPWVG